MTVQRAAIVGGVLAGLAAGAVFALAYLIASIPDDPPAAAWARQQRAKGRS